MMDGNMARFGSAALLGFSVALALGTSAFACGADNGEQPRCEGATCEDGRAPDGPDGSTPSEAGQETGTTDGGRDATDTGDAADTGTNCTGPAGTLDPTFGDGGIVVLSYGNETASADAVAIQPDGKIVVGGVKTKGGQGFAVVRLMPNGSLDATFGTAGLVETKVGNTSHVLSALALQPDGKILIAGYTRFVGQNFDFAVLRYSANGTLDPTFGTEGVVLTDFGTRTDQAMAMALMTDGRIVVSGQTLSDDLTVADMAFVRYNPDGSLDTTFGASGRTMIDVRGTPDQARSVSVLPGGKILAAGTSRDPNVSRLDIAAVRLSSDGSLDTTFGAEGKFVSNFGGPGSDTGNAMNLDSTGRLVITGLAAGIDFGVLRLTADGAPDPAFGGSGFVRADFMGRNDYASAVALQADGRIVSAGSSSGATLTDKGVAVVRYLPDGGFDPSFGGTGTFLNAVPSGFSGGSGISSGLAIDACTAVVVGSWFEDGVGLSRMGLMRLRR